MDGSFPMLTFGMSFPLPVLDLMPVPDQVWQEAMLHGSATQLLLGGVDGVGLPPAEAVSFPLPSGSLSRGGGELKGEQKRQRLRDLEEVAYGLSLQHNCGERMTEEQFAPFPLLIPFGWRPDPVIQEKKAPARQERRMHAHAKVFIGGLPTSTTEEDLKNYFGAFGPVISADILMDGETRKSRGFGFIHFDGPVPEGVIGRNHYFGGRSCGTRIYDQRPEAYTGGYMAQTNLRFERLDRYGKGKGKGEADADAGKGRSQGPKQRRRGNQPAAPQSAQLDDQPAAPSLPELPVAPAPTSE
jgi:hypothetical protein